MSPVTKIAVFVAGLVALFGVAWGVGSAVGPVGTPAVSHDADHDAAQDSAHGDHDVTTAGLTGLGGLAVAQDGYRLVLATPDVAAGTGRAVSFTIAGPDGAPVVDYDVRHEKELHLIVVRRDVTGFQHVHPTRSADGTWTADVDLTPGTWRVFADFKAAGAPALTLGADLAVPGTVAAAPDLQQKRSTTIDGYTVSVDGELVAGQHATLTLRVAREGVPVTDLQPYLGAYGHLVALREGDLAYLHVHPGGVPGDGTTEPGPAIAFGAEVPTPGRYHLYLDFRHDGVVRTAQLALDAAPAHDHDDHDHGRH